MSRRLAAEASSSTATEFKSRAPTIFREQILPHPTLQPKEKTRMVRRSHL